jgi:signal transduction histidine kinase
MNAVHAVRSRPDGAGELTISIATRDQKLRIEVADNGPGIPGDVIERVFDPMFTTKADGVGLGLSISREFARAAGGDLFVKESGPSGTCFVFEIAAAPAAVPPSTESQSA